MADQDMSDIGLDSDPRDMEREEEDSFIKQPKERDRRGQEDPVVIIEDETERRLTSSSQLMLGTSGAHPRGRPNGAATSPAHPESFERSCVVIPENEIEAHRISNNYKVSTGICVPDICTYMLSCPHKSLISCIGEEIMSVLLFSTSSHTCFHCLHR